LFNPNHPSERVPRWRDCFIPKPWENRDRSVRPAPTWALRSVLRRCSFTAAGRWPLSESPCRCIFLSLFCVQGLAWSAGATVQLPLPAASLRIRANLHICDQSVGCKLWQPDAQRLWRKPSRTDLTKGQRDPAETGRHRPPVSPIPSVNTANAACRLRPCKSPARQDQSHDDSHRCRFCAIGCSHPAQRACPRFALSSPAFTMTCFQI
jgi:hypothetical protein